MGLDDYKDRGSDSRFPGAKPRTDFAEQIAAGNERAAAGNTDAVVLDDARVHRIVEDTVEELTGSSDKFSSVRRDDFRRARSLAADQWGVTAADLDGRTNWAANHYKITYGRWPTATELINYAPYQDSLWTFASGAAFHDRLFERVLEDGSTQLIVNSGLTWQAIDDPMAEFYERGGDFWRGPQKDIPSYTDEQLSEILGNLSPVNAGSGSGRRSSGGGRAPAVFDRAHLSEQVTQRWRGLLLEEPDDATLNQVVSDYIAQANAFWMKDGGNLDFDTFVVNRIRTQERHNYLYAQKPEFQSEAEYMSGYRQATGQYGLGENATLREVEAGAHSGAGLAGFSERVGRTAEARVQNQGSYSQRFAASMAQSGLGMT